MRKTAMLMSNINLITARYVDKEESAYSIGKEFGTSAKTILKVLRTVNIPIRNGCEALRISGLHRAINLEQRVASDVKALYLNDHLTEQEIGKKLHISTQIISRCLKHSNCLRTVEQSKALRGSGAKEKHYRWKGIRERRGYIYVYRPNHPRATKHGYVLEHLIVWEESHNRPLPKGWVVHHLNGIRSDNKPSNLVGLPNRKHNILIPEMQRKVRQLEIENRQLRRALEDSQMILYFNEN